MISVDHPFPLNQNLSLQNNLYPSNGLHVRRVWRYQSVIRNCKSQKRRQRTLIYKKSHIKQTIELFFFFFFFFLFFFFLICFCFCFFFCFCLSPLFHYFTVYVNPMDHAYVLLCNLVYFFSNPILCKSID
jgi:hypothetical protein